MKLSQRGSLRKKKKYFCTSCLYSNFASNYLPILGYRQMRGTAENEEETYISYGRMIIRCDPCIDGTHGHGAPASGH